MAVSNTAHSVDNYYEGKGIVKIGPIETPNDPDNVGWRDIGNVPEFSIEPTVEKRDHFSSRTGKRTKDASYVIEQGGTVRIVMEDFNAANLALILMGAPVAGIGGAVNEFTMPLFAETDSEYAILFTGTNDIGPRVNIYLPRVSFTPSGEVGFISEDQGQIEVEAEILGIDDGLGGTDFGTLVWNPYIAP